MKTSEQIDQFASALLVAQQAIRAVVKDKTGKVQLKSGGEYSYKYSDLSSVIEHVKGPLNEAGIVFMQGASGDATGVAVETRLIHTSGQWAATTIYLPVGQGTAQAFGSAITYGKRYGLQAMVGLPSEDDDGQKASEPVKDEPKRMLDQPIPANTEGKTLFESMDAEQKDYYSSHARALEKLDQVDGYDYLTREQFTDEEKLVLSWLLPPKIRNALKTEGTLRRAMSKQNGKALASQA